MSLAEIEEAVDKLSLEKLSKLAAHIARRDKVAWDKEIEEDSLPGGKHHEALEQIDSETDAGNFARRDPLHSVNVFLFSWFKKSP